MCGRCWPTPHVAVYIMSHLPGASLFTHPELQMGAPYVEEVLDIVSDVYLFKLGSDTWSSGFG